MSEHSSHPCQETQDWCCCGERVLSRRIEGAKVHGDSDVSCYFGHATRELEAALGNTGTHCQMIKFVGSQGSLQQIFVVEFQVNIVL